MDVNKPKRMGKNIMIIGYTAGTFDLFHVGHLNLLRSAKALCDKLIVGVSADEIISYKRKECVIPITQRIEIVRSCKYVDVAIPQRSLDKIEAWHKIKYNILFVGDDWYNNIKWNEYEEQLIHLGAKIIYFPYTKVPETSTTSIINRIKESF